MAPVIVLAQFLTVVLISRSVICAEDLQNYRKESYSTSGAEVNNQHIALDAYPLQSYTHYLKSSDYQGTYNFTVHVRQSGISTGIGMFITSWELHDPGTGTDTEPSRICSRYSIKFSYPEDKGKTPKYLCTPFGEYTTSLTDLVALEDYHGLGKVVVEISRRFPYSGFNGDLFSSLNDSPWVSTSGRSIPGSSIGGITFTLYQDCSTSSLLLRSCSTYQKTRCIARKLFCNGEVNCVISIWDYLLFNTDKGTNSTTSQLEQDTEPSYDESKKMCGGTKNSIWEKTTYKYSNSYGTYGGGSGYSYSYGGGGSTGGTGIPIKLIGGGLVVVLGLAVIIWKALKQTPRQAHAGVEAPGIRDMPNKAGPGWRWELRNGAPGEQRVPLRTEVA